MVATTSFWPTSVPINSFITVDQYYPTLAEALRTRLALIANHQLRDQYPAAHLAKLKEAAERIDLLVRQLPKDADPMLAHYLQKQSFSKALEWLEHMWDAG
jgi:hypothetical protein